MLQHTSNPDEPTVNAATPARTHHLLILSANTEAGVRDAAIRLADHLKHHPTLNIADVAYTMHSSGAMDAYRWFAVCQDRTDAITVLETIAAKHITVVNNPTMKRPVAFLFPGLGEQYVELARALYQDEPDFRETVEHCCDLLRLHMNLDIREIFASEALPGGASQSLAPRTLDFQAFVRRSGHDITAPLAQPALAHPATFVLEYALTCLLARWGIRPSAMLGYSLGEYVAANLSGVLSLEDALLLVAKRASMLTNAPKGAMLAVNLAEQDVYSYLSNQVSLATVSSPITCVLAGNEEAIEHLRRLLTSRDIVCYRVTTTYAFHSPMLNPLRQAITDVARNLTHAPPQIPYISNVTGTWITDREATDASYWATHMCQTVRFADGVQRLLEHSDCFVLEVGPGRSLSSFVKQHPSCGLRRMSFVQATLPAPHEHQSCQFFLLQTLGKLWQAGVAIDWTSSYAHEQRQRIALPISKNGG